MRLWVLVGGIGNCQLAGFVIDVGMALARTVDAIGPMKTRVEPLRAVGGAHLHRQHVAIFIIEGTGIVFSTEVAALKTPIGPGSSKTVEHLASIGLAAETLRLRKVCKGLLVRNRAPCP